MNGIWKIPSLLVKNFLEKEKGSFDIPMDRADLSEYQSYDMRTFFSAQPGVLKTCIRCNRELSEIEVNRNTKSADKWYSSRPSIPVYELSLFYCEKCQWWYMREYFSDCEVSSEQEYITIGHNTFSKAEEKKRAIKPWGHAFEDETLHANPQSLPPSIGSKFPAN